MPRLFDRYDDDDEPRNVNVECKRCGVDGLEWHQDGDAEHGDASWVLTDHRRLVHVCDPAQLAKLVAKDFD